MKRLVQGSVNAEVTLAIASGVERVSRSIRTSVAKLGWKRGQEVWAVIQSHRVRERVDHPEGRSRREI